jgi:hypothetical protein
MFRMACEVPSAHVGRSLSGYMELYTRLAVIPSHTNIRMAVRGKLNDTEGGDISVSTGTNPPPRHGRNCTPWPPLTWIILQSVNGSLNLVVGVCAARPKRCFRVLDKLDNGDVTPRAENADQPNGP